MAAFIAVSAAKHFALLASSNCNGSLRDTIQPARQVSSRAASSAMSMSASMNDTPWFAITGFPNCVRSRA